MKITDLLDDVCLEGVSLTEVQTPTAERIKEITKGKIAPVRRRRLPVGLLVAAVLALMLSISAGAAYYITHERTVTLMETGPNSGGYRTVEVDEKSKAVIEAASRDMGLTAEDTSGIVTLDSVMGFGSEDYSVVYMTLTLTPPAGTEFTADISECGFWLWQPDVKGATGGANGSSVAVDNGDGTISVMLMYEFRADIRGQEMTLTLEDFGNVSKEVAKPLAEGTREIELPGKWEFTVASLELDDPVEVTFDPAAFAGAASVPQRIALSAFGGVVITAAGETTELGPYLGALQTVAPEVDWTQVTTLEQLKLLLAEGAVFTDQQTEMIYDLLATETDFVSGAETVQLLYPDGTAYDALTNFWFKQYENGIRTELFLFEAPQAIEEAEYLAINGVKLPLQ